MEVQLNVYKRVVRQMWHILIELKPYLISNFAQIGA